MTKTGNIPAQKGETVGLNQKGSNISQLKTDISNGVKAINNQIDKRQACNDEIASIKADLVAKGIHKEALNMAMKYMNMDADKREGFDVAYDIVREAIGMPVKAQGDMFENQEGGEKSDG